VVKLKCHSGPFGPTFGHGIRLCGVTQAQFFQERLWMICYLSSRVGCLYTARNVSTTERVLRQIWPPMWTGTAPRKAVWNSRSVRAQSHVQATGALWAACCVWRYLLTVGRQQWGALPSCLHSLKHCAMSDRYFRALIAQY